MDHFIEDCMITRAANGFIVDHDDGDRNGVTAVFGTFAQAVNYIAGKMLPIEKGAAPFFPQ